MKYKENGWKLLAVIMTVAVMLVFWIGSRLIRATKTDTKPQDMPLVETTPKPTSWAKVVLDPGHGGFDRGASGSRSGTPESELNLDVAIKTKAQLEKANIQVILTRDTENAIAGTKKEDMKLRRSIMHESGADLTVSIHMNMFSDTSIHGAMVFYTKGDDRSNSLAEHLMNSICDVTGEPRRLVNTGDYYIIRNSEIPAVIVECGFLSNPTDEKNLCDSEYREKLAKGIVGGIIQFLNTDAVCSSENAK